MNPAVLGIAPPPIPEARAWAESYDGRSGPAIDLTQAVPGYPAHPELIARLREAAGNASSYGYGEITGDLDLRMAYAAEIARIYGGRFAPEEVAITTGANMASFAVTLLLAAAGDAIMLPVPWYFNHQMNAAMQGVEIVPLPCRAEQGFVPDAAEAEALLTDRVKAILLVTPNNPTGAVYPPATIEAFARLCARRGLTLVLDETYRDFLPPGPERPHGLLESGARDGFVQIYSFSKSYCVPGFRAGAVVGTAPLVRQLAKVLDCLQICAPRVGQAGLAWAIGALREWRAGNRVLMTARAEACRAALGQIEGWRLDAQGSYFAYLRHPFEDLSSWQVAERLAREVGVVSLPGEAFGPGQTRHLRLAFANVEAESLQDAAERLRRFQP